VAWNIANRERHTVNQRAYYKRNRDVILARRRAADRDEIANQREAA